MTKNKAMLQALKTEAANAVNVNLKQGYNGDITAREAGSIGGEMVKRMIAYAEHNMNGGNMMKEFIKWQNHAVWTDAHNGVNKMLRLWHL